MNTLIKLLEKEKELNYSLNSKNFIKDIHQKFIELFNHQAYQNTAKFLDAKKEMSLHDSYIQNFSQKKKINGYHILFTVEPITIYEEKQEVGYIQNSVFEIITSESLRSIQNRCIMNFLIDENKKQLAFLVLEGNHKKVIGIDYEKIFFKKGEEIFYEKKVNKIKKMDFSK
jgi:hypothetical protein